MAANPFVQLAASRDEVPLPTPSAFFFRVLDGFCAVGDEVASLQDTRMGLDEVPLSEP